MNLKIDFSKPNDHAIFPENCLFAHYYSDETRGKTSEDRAPTGEEFASKMQEVVKTKEKTNTIIQYILNEFTVHIGVDDYHLSLNRIFKPILQTKSQETEEIYTNLWKSLSTTAESETGWTVFDGETEIARNNPLVAGLAACKV